MTPAEKYFNRFFIAFITVCYVRVVVCIIHFIKMWFYEYTIVQYQILSQEEWKNLINITSSSQGKKLKIQISS